LGFKFVESFQEKGVGLIEKLTDAITKFDPQPVIDAVITAGNAIGGMIKTVWQLRHFILGVAIAWGVYKTAMLGAAVAAKILTLVKAVNMLAHGQKLATVAQWAFNTAANANPIGLIITAIGILIGLFILAYQKCEPFRNAVNGILEKLKALGVHILQVLAPAFEIIKGVFQKVISVIGEIFGTVGRLISIFFGLFNITGQVSGSFSFLDSVLKIISGTIQFVWTLLGGIVDTIGALFSGINDIIDAFKNGGFIAGIKQIGLSILNYILTPIRAILDAISIIPGIGDLAKGASEKIGQFQESLRYHRPESETEQATPVEAAAMPPAARVPAAPVNAVPTQITAPSAPVTTAPGTAARAVNQPVFLQLQNPVPGGETVTRTAAGPASPWSVPVTYTGGTIPDIMKAVSIPAEFDIGDYDIPAAPVKAVTPQI
jgi:hypothetical protein